MSVRLIGAHQLHLRLDAIKPGHELMRDFSIAAVAEQKRLVPRKTGNLARSIRIGAVTPQLAETIAGANYAAYVEFGTRPHDIVPVRAKALAWPAKGSATLSGRVRKGGRTVFARRVRHPGTKPKPYMVPGAVRALEAVGLKPLTDRWDRAV